MGRERLGKMQTRCLVAIANGYQANDYRDPVCLALRKKNMLAPGFGTDRGWIATQKALDWLASDPNVHVVTHRTYYLNPGF